MLPLNVVDINNQTRIGDKMINIDMAKSSEVYNNFLKKKADTLYAGSKLDEFQKLSNIQQLIENGNATLINQLKAELVSSQPKSDEVEVTSTNPAKIYGLYPKKGTISIGSDADIVIWETGIEKTITNSDLHHDTDHTPYEGMKVNCWPSIVLSRGKIIVQDGQLQGEKGYGQFLKSEISSYVY